MRESSDQRMALEKGDIDMGIISYKAIPRFREMKSMKVYLGPAAGYAWVGMNVLKKPFDNVKVRKAFQYAIDKKALSDAVYGARGRTIDTVVPPGVPGFTDDVLKYPHDPDKAKKLLEEAGLGGIVVLLMFILGHPGTWWHSRPGCCPWLGLSAFLGIALAHVLMIYVLHQSGGRDRERRRNADAVPDLLRRR
jgi:peptide/nickel transport system substrate-binding protein